METVNFKCSHCGNLMGVSTEYLAMQVRCPHCQQVVVAPAAKPAPSRSGNLEETMMLPSSNDEGASIFSETDRTLALTGAPHPEGSPAALDATLPMNHAPASEAASNPDVPDWMKPIGPATAVTDQIPPETMAHEMPVPQSVKGARGGTSLGMLLFWSLVFMPLVLYAGLVTVLAILFYNHTSPAPPDPREYLNDLEGDHPGVKKVQRGGRPLEVDVKMATQPLPDYLRIKLGDTITFGDLRVKAEAIDRGEIKMRTPGYEKADSIETLLLRLHLTNLSKEAAFYPMDCYFDRKWKNQREDGWAPYTVLLAGDQLRFFGGPAIWNRGPLRREHNPSPRNFVVGNNYDKQLQPGDEMDTFVCVDGNDPKWDELAQYKGPFVWHVHVRRGLVRWKDHDYSATAVFGVEFTDQDIRQAN